MNNRIFTTLFLVSAFALGGCSSTGSNSGSTAPAAPAAAAAGKPGAPPAAATAEDLKNVDKYGRLLTGKELKEVMWGKHVKGFTAYKLYGMVTSYETKFANDGTFVVKSSGMEDNGKYWIDGDKWCMHWSFFQRKDICTYVRVKDGKYTDYNEAKVWNFFEIVKD